MSPGLTSFHGESCGDSGFLGGPEGRPSFRALSPTVLYRLSPPLRPILAEKAVAKAVGAEQAPRRGRRCTEGLRGLIALSPCNPPGRAVPVSQTRGLRSVRSGQAPRGTATAQQRLPNPTVTQPARPVLGHLLVPSSRVTRLDEAQAGLRVRRHPGAPDQLNTHFWALLSLCRGNQLSNLLFLVQMSYYSFTVNTYICVYK